MAGGVPRRCCSARRLRSGGLCTVIAVAPGSALCVRTALRDASARSATLLLGRSVDGKSRCALWKNGCREMRVGGPKCCTLCVSQGEGCSTHCTQLWLASCRVVVEAMATGVQVHANRPTSGTSKHRMGAIVPEGRHLRSDVCRA